MTKVMQKAYTEVDEILKYLPQEYVEKVPQKFRRMFHDFKIENYDIDIDPNKPISEQNVIYETRVILAILKYHYWCKSDEEKKQIEEILRKNEKKNKDVYDISNLMVKKEQKAVTEVEKIDTTQKVSQSNLPIVAPKTSWFSRLIDKIKKLLKK